MQAGGRPTHCRRRTREPRRRREGGTARRADLALPALGAPPTPATPARAVGSATPRSLLEKESRPAAGEAGDPCAVDEVQRASLHDVSSLPGVAVEGGEHAPSSRSTGLEGEGGSAAGDGRRCRRYGVEGKEREGRRG